MGGVTPKRSAMKSLGGREAWVKKMRQINVVTIKRLTIKRVLIGKENIFLLPGEDVTYSQTVLGGLR